MFFGNNTYLSEDYGTKIRLLLKLLLQVLPKRNDFGQPLELQASDDFATLLLLSADLDKGSIILVRSVGAED